MIFRSVSARLATWMLLGSALVLGVTGAALLEHTRRQVLAQTHREALALANGTAARIAARVSDAMAITRVLHTVLPGRTADAATMLPDVMRGHPDLSGIAVSFKPANDLPRTTLLVFRGPDGAIGSVDLTQHQTDAWYAQGLSCADGCWHRSFMAQYAWRQRRRLHPADGTTTPAWWLRNLPSTGSRPCWAAFRNLPAAMPS